MAAAAEEEGQEKITETNTRFGRVGCLGWFGSTLLGGLILVWWDLNYHPAYHHLWMVPVGLILFATPLIVWFSVVMSSLCSVSYKESVHNGSEKKPCDHC